MAVGEARARLIGVVHGAVDAVAEAELAGEVDGEPAGAVAEVVLLDARDEVAVIALGEDVRDFVLAIEALAEDERARQHYSRTSEARGVSASSGRSAAGAALPIASSTWPRTRRRTPRRRAR